MPEIEHFNAAFHLHRYHKGRLLWADPENCRPSWCLVKLRTCAHDQVKKKNLTNITPCVAKQPWVENSFEENDPCPHPPTLHLSWAEQEQTCEVWSSQWTNRTKELQHLNMWNSACLTIIFSSQLQTLSSHLWKKQRLKRNKTPPLTFPEPNVFRISWCCLPA